jgi:hypothetical protein
MRTKNRKEMRLIIMNFKKTFLILSVLSASLISHADQQPGLTVVDGTLYKDGASYRAVGVNYCDLFQSMIHFPEYTGQTTYRTIDGLNYLGQQKIPFVRFWACGFWPSDWDLYFQDKDEWFSRMDLLVATAEQANVGLIPSLFWRTETIPELMGEYREAWGDPTSLTRQFMVTYTQEFVTRYKDSPAIWGWEFANEFNLPCNLPNWDLFLGTVILSRGVVGPATEVDIRNKMTYEIAESVFHAFSQEVRKLDTHRFITTGSSNPRKASWNNWYDNSWTADNYDQAKEAFGWMQPPASIDMASLHFYTKDDPDDEMEYAGAYGAADVLARYREFCDDQNQAMFIGEYSSFYDGAGDLDSQRATEEELLSKIVTSGADLTAQWVFDYTYNRTTVGIIREDNDYTWVLDKIRKYDAKARDEVAYSLSGVPLDWFGQYWIAPTGNMTIADLEALDPDGDGFSTGDEYYNGTNPTTFDQPDMLTGDQGLSDFAKFGAAWLQTNCGLCFGADLSGDGNVNIDDLIMFSQNWLAEN